jgi:hypothetical protein
LASCEYLEGGTQNELKLGVFRYELDSPGSPYSPLRQRF